MNWFIFASCSDKGISEYPYWSSTICCIRLNCLLVARSPTNLSSSLITSLKKSSIFYPGALAILVGSAPWTKLRRSWIWIRSVSFDIEVNWLLVSILGIYLSGSSSSMRLAKLKWACVFYIQLRLPARDLLWLVNGGKLSVDAMLGDCCI